MDKFLLTFQGLKVNYNVLQVYKTFVKCKDRALIFVVKMDIACNRNAIVCKDLHYQIAKDVLQDI